MSTRTDRRLVAVVAGLIFLATACNTNGGGKSAGDATSTSPASMSAQSSPTASGTTSSPATDTPPEASLAGKWVGTWANSKPDHSTGTITILWKQKGDSLSGTISISGTPCLTGGSITGKLRPGGSINFGVVQGQVEVNYAGLVKGDRISGNYATTCGNAEGEWKAHRP